MWEELTAYKTLQSEIKAADIICVDEHAIKLNVERVSLLVVAVEHL